MSRSRCISKRLWLGDSCEVAVENELAASVRQFIHARKFEGDPIAFATEKTYLNS
jgi:hypothetical protein